MAQSDYLTRFVRYVKQHIAEHSGALTHDELMGIVRTARAEAGGKARAEKARKDRRRSDAGADERAVAAAVAQAALDDDDDDDDTSVDIPNDIWAIEDSYEDQIDDVRLAVRGAFGPSYKVLGTFDGYCLCAVLSLDGSDPTFYRIEYSVDDDDVITLGQRTQVDQNVTFTPAATKAEEIAADRELRRILLSEEWTEDVRGEDAEVVTLAAGTTDKPWSGDSGRYPDAESYCRAALLDRNPSGKAKSKALCSMPVREPDGTLNVNALGAAAAAIAGARSPLKATEAEKAAAKRKLRGLYAQVKRDPPDSIKAEDKDNVAVPSPAQAAGPTDSTGADAQLSLTQPVSTLVALRLADAGGTLPAWQQLHRIGTHAIEHAVSGKIALTRRDGDSMIRNHQANVLRRPVPLDYRHLTDEGGEALGWLEEVRWGSEGQGLPGASEPSGTGDILYGRFRYTDIGQQKLSNEHYKCISPQYDLKYTDKQSGRVYGPTITAVAATNNPFLRLRTIQGEPAPEPVLLEDGLPVGQRGRIRSHEQSERPQGTGSSEGALTMAEQVQLSEMQTKLTDYERRIQLAETQLQEERRERHRAEVDAWHDSMIHAGTPPAVVDVARRILLQTDPRAEGVVQLDDAQPDARANLYASIKKLVESVPALSLGARTVGDYRRPPQETRLDAGPADEQIQAATAEVLGAMGIEFKPKAGAGAGSNGNGAHS